MQTRYPSLGSLQVSQTGWSSDLLYAKTHALIIVPHLRSDSATPDTVRLRARGRRW
jgi:hypothetical protein